METQDKAIQKTTYMREWKRKKYRENPDTIKEKNKAYYCKYKYNITSEEMKKYDTCLPLVAKLRNSLEMLKHKHPEFINEIIAPYLEPI